MSLKRRFIIFSAVFFILAGMFLYLIDSQTDEVKRARRHIKDDWAETRLLFEINMVLGNLHKEFESLHKSEEDDIKTALSTYEHLLGVLKEHASDDVSHQEGEDMELSAISRLEQNLMDWRQLQEQMNVMEQPQLIDETNRLYQMGSIALTAFAEGAWQEMDDSLGDLGKSENRIEAMTVQWTVGMFGLLVMAWLGFLFWLMRPIRHLQRMVRKLRDRNFVVRDSVAQQGEIGELTRSFIEMSEELRVFTEDLESLVNVRTQELESSRQQIKQMLDRLPDAVGLADEKGEILSANDSHRHLFGSGNSSRIEEL